MQSEKLAFTYGKTALPLAMFLVSVFSAAPTTLWAQSLPITYRSSLSISSANGEQLPFWLTTNQFGVVDPGGTNAALRFAAFNSREVKKNISYQLGVDIVGRASPEQAFFFQQLYGELKLGPFLLRAGRKEQTAGMVHSYLSLGSMIVSPNAAPLTRVSISWPDYVSIPGTDGFVAVKGYLGHGWVGGDRIVQNPFLHEKNLYMRLGGKNWPIHGHAGILHYAMWGGTHVNPAIGRLPSGFSDFLRVFFVQGADEGSGLNGEVTNVLGNSLGAYDFKLDVDLKRLKIRAYRQFYLEDTVSMAFRNALDGMWGLSLTFIDAPIRGFLYEHVNTKQQSSKNFEIERGEYGTDNYYNHGLFSSGWTNRGRVIGIPLVLTQEGFEGVVDNILLGHHFALEGALKDAVAYKLLFTYSKNYGAHSIRDSETGLRIENARTPGRHLYTSMLDLERLLFPAHNITGYIRIAYDWGDVRFDRNLGVTLGIVRNGVWE